MTPARPRDFGVEEIGGDAADAETWERLLDCFNEDGAIIEEPDPLDHLYDFLWHVGIRDAAGFVDNCLGILLRLFAEPSDAVISQLAWDLSRVFQTARDFGPGPIRRIGFALEQEDVALDPQCDADREVLFNIRP